MSYNENIMWAEFKLEMIRVEYIHVFKRHLRIDQKHNSLLR